MSSRILNVPYKSQNDPDAQLENNDCGPACVAMILAAQGLDVRTSDVYDASGVMEDHPLTFAEVTIAASHYGLPLNARVGLSLQDIRNYIDRGTPIIALVKYQYLPDRQGQGTVGGHFVLVVGYDDDAGEIIIHDPYYWGPLRSKGAHHRYDYATWEQAWGRCDEDGNPNHSALVPQLVRPVPTLPGYTPSAPLPGVVTVYVLPAADKYGGLKLRPVRDVSVMGQPVFSGRPLTVVQGPVEVGDTTWLLVRTQTADDIAGWACVQSGGEAYIGDRPNAATPTTIQPITPPRRTVYVQPDADQYGGLKLRPMRDVSLGGPAMQSGTALYVVAEPVGAGDNEWLLVTAQDGQDTAGWVRVRQGREIYVSDAPPGRAALPVSEAPRPEPVQPAVGDVWVIAPNGLRLRVRRDIPAAPDAPIARFGQHLTALGPETGPDDMGRTWQQVRTDQGEVAWVAASENGERYLSNIKAYAVRVLDTKPVREAGGLRLRELRNTEAMPVDTAQIGERLDVYYRVIEADGTPWLWVKSLRGRYGWARERAEGVVLVAQMPVVDVRPFGKCLAGLGMANVQPLTSQELFAVATSRVEAFKVLTLPNPNDNKELVKSLKDIRPDMFIAARLFFACDPNNRFSPQNFVETVWDGMEALYQSGVRYFEVHNEPNLPLEGMGWNWRNGAEFGEWFVRVVEILRGRFPEAKFGFPGVSPQPNVPDFLEGAGQYVLQADWVGVHCYWQSADQPPYPMTADNAGMYWRSFRERYPDKLLMITEFSNNSPDVPAAEKGRQYARYYQLLRHEPNLGAAFAFALSWPGQDINREGWVLYGQATLIPTTVGALIGQPEFLA